MSLATAPLAAEEATAAAAPRLAMFAPVPPAPTGVADYVRDLLAVLPDGWRIDLFCPEREASGDMRSATPSASAVPVPERAAADAGAPASVYPISAWAARHAAAPYDLNVHHVGNGPHHAAIIDHALAHPGLLVLHDAVLHPSRLAREMAAYDLSGYRGYATACRADVGAAIAHLVAGGVADPLLYWTFPLCEDVVRASRLTVVHGEMLAAWLRAVVPGARVGSVAHWREVPACSADAVQAWRRRLAAEKSTLVGTFGHLGDAHCVDLVLQAAADLSDRGDVRFAVVGEAGAELISAARRRGVEDLVHFTGRVEESDFGALLRAVDIGLNLRYPTARASSGPLTQLMQLGVPCIVHDLVHLRDLPDAAVRRVPPAPADDQRDALRRALAGWLDDVDGRAAAGRAAADWARRHASPAAAASSYAAAVEEALAGA